MGVAKEGAIQTPKKERESEGCLVKNTGRDGEKEMQGMWWESFRDLRAFNKNSESWGVEESRHAEAGCLKLPDIHTQLSP